MSQHNTPPPDDHVSAYLDGELPAEEHARIEQLIATDDHYRQLAEDLRQLRARLRGLPPYQLRSDLSDRVLRQAERESLRPVAPIITSKTSRRWSSGSLAAAAAIVAALMLMVFWPRNPDLANRELARLDPSPQSESIGEPSGAPAPEDDNSFGDSFDEVSGHSARRSSVDSNGTGSMRDGQDAQLRTELSTPTLGESDIASSLSARTGEMSDKAFRQLAELEPAEELDDQRFGDELFSLHDFGATPSPDLIVLVEVPREALHQRRLDESLLRHDILFDEPGDRPVVEPTESNEGGKAGNRPLDTRVADAPSDPEPLDEVGQAGVVVAGESVDAKNNKQSLPDLVYVSATRAQIDATLRDLRQRPDAFLRVTLRVAERDSHQPTSGEKSIPEEFEAELSDDASPALRKTRESENRNGQLVIGRVPGELASSPEDAIPRVRGLAKRLNAASFRLRNAPDSDRQDAALSKDGVQQDSYFQRTDADKEGRQEANGYRAAASKDEADRIPVGHADPDRIVRVLFLVRAVEQ